MWSTCHQEHQHGGLAGRAGEMSPNRSNLQVSQVRWTPTGWRWSTQDNITCRSVWHLWQSTTPHIWAKDKKRPEVCEDDPSNCCTTVTTTPNSLRLPWFYGRRRPPRISENIWYDSWKIFLAKDVYRHTRMVAVMSTMSEGQVSHQKPPSLHPDSGHPLWKMAHGLHWTSSTCSWWNQIHFTSGWLILSLARSLRTPELWCPHHRRVLYSEIFTRYGAPGALVSDRGPQFMSSLVNALCEIFQVKRAVTSPYHPQSNAVC